MTTIIYKGEKYPIRQITMLDNGSEFTRIIADDRLFDVISKYDKYLEAGTLEQEIDSHIYHYVASSELKMDAEYICQHCLDEEFIFVKEEE